MNIKLKILNELKSFNNEVNKYNNNIKKFKKKNPKADVYVHLSSKLSNGIFVKKYGNKIEFFRVDRVFSQNDQNAPLIELEKRSVHCWSCSSSTQITTKQFANYYFEVDKNYVKEEIKKYKIKELEAIKKLEKDTLKKLDAVYTGGEKDE